MWRVSEEGAIAGDYIINVVTALRLFAPGAPHKKLANVPRGDNARLFLGATVLPSAIDFLVGQRTRRVSSV